MVNNVPLSLRERVRVRAALRTGNNLDGLPAISSMMPDALFAASRTPPPGLPPPQHGGRRGNVIFSHPNGLPYPRLGISALRRSGPSAVVRNRWKRLVGEAFRLRRTELPEGIDLIVIPRPEAEPTLASLVDSLPRSGPAVGKEDGPMSRRADVLRVVFSQFPPCC